MAVVHAAPLTQEQCVGLRQLKQELKTRGLEKTLAKGAKWAADNLNAAQLSEVGAFLKLGEEIRFRCSKSAPDKKKSRALVRVRPPVRNPRRVRQKKAETSQKISPEVRSVLSAVTGNKKKSTANSKSDLQDKDSKK